MTETQQLQWSGPNGDFHSITVVKPGSVAAPDLTAAATGLIAGQKKLNSDKGKLQQARDDLEAFGQRAQQQAVEANRLGEKFDKAKSKRKKQAIRDLIDDLELDVATGADEMRRLHAAHADAVRANVERLVAAARGDVTSAINSLGAGVSLIARAGGSLKNSLATLKGLVNLDEVGEFVPVDPRARRRTSDELIAATNPAPYVSEAAAKLGTAIDFAVRILDDLTDDAKAAAKQAKLDAEEDASVTIESGLDEDDEVDEVDEVEDVEISTGDDDD